MDRAIEPEAIVLGNLLLNGPVIEQTVGLCFDDFLLEAHRKVFRRMTELHQGGQPIDIVTVSDALERYGELRSVGGVAFLSDLTSSVVERPNIRHYAAMIREAAGRRYISHETEALSQQAHNGAQVSALRTRLAAIAEEASGYEANDNSIQSLTDIPDLFTFTASLDYLISDLFPRASLCLLTGAPGVGKSFLALRLASCVALGGDFLGCSCERTPVLYLDKENPLALVQWRLGVIAAGSVPGLHIWGNWLADEPPAIRDSRLPKIAKKRPLIVFDSLVRFHAADENSASEMRAVMALLRKLADLGATVLILHHRSKAEGNKYRGSSDILAAVDLAYSLEQTPEGILKLHRFKSRFAGETIITINADFANGRFEITDSPAMAEARDNVAAITELIAAEPGILQAEIIRRLRINRTTGCNLLRANTGKVWRVEKGERNSLRYFPLSYTAVPIQLNTAGTGALSCTAVPAPLGAVQGTARTVQMPQ